MRLRVSLAIVMVGVAAFSGATSRQPDDGSTEFTSDFALNHANLVPDGHNLYFSLEPGTVSHYEGNEGPEFHELEIKVLDQTHPVTFTINGHVFNVTTRIIREREKIDGELAEVSRNFFARDTRTGNVYYFGEEVDLYENGVIVGHEGQWEAGINGALPGLAMPGSFLLGARYMQELAAPVALDRAKHIQMGVSVSVPAGDFDDCVVVRESTQLEPGTVEDKTYAPGVGLIIDDTLELIDYQQPD